MYLQYLLARRRVLENWRKYVEALCAVAKALLGEARVIVFGSVARGDWAPDSDIDVLIVSPNAPDDPWKRAEISLALKDAAGEASSVLELHIVTPRQYEDWYKKFIDAEVEIC
ncbi:nucleotidyltransferase domain-containing protein [Pyrobaculum aerophilum]|uniref:DNA polymerase subunit beta n=1 Tax=Pyrobaculum aerophilum TaxID=13773 RepID=A0A371R123_9CREN|nr:nucleotidyltransferase domain-containing protein [Pyrobaculum aerophilum]RFA97157.1 DNA polymerase subunit beta [Pyrobaculum aerophilum]RFB00056.1 DNA polymerase subunit beta [Pyrobaculum aerophilum]